MASFSVVLCVPGNVPEVGALCKKGSHRAALVLFGNTRRGGDLRLGLASPRTHLHKTLHPFIFSFLLCTMKLE